MLVRQKGVNQIKRRLADGTVRTYYYHRETGLRLPDDPTSPDFAARLQDLNQPSLATEWPARSVGALVAAYKASPDFKQLAPVSQKDYSRYIDIVLEMWGNLPTAGIERRHVLTARDKFADRPRSANYLTQIIRRLLSFAVERGWRADNPATRPRMLKTGDGYRAWTAGEIESFRKHHSAGTAMRTAFELGIGTGQRQADIMGMPWSAYDGSGIRVRQSKTGARLFVPCPKTLREYLTKVGLDKKSLLILARQDGAAYKADHFRHDFAEAIKDAGLGGAGLVFHGLRHTAATELANAGCDAEMVRSITGHSSLSMVQHYTKGADQERRARAAITRLDRSRVPKRGK